MLKEALSPKGQTPWTLGLEEGRTGLGWVQDYQVCFVLLSLGCLKNSKYLKINSFNALLFVVDQPETSSSSSSASDFYDHHYHSLSCSGRKSRIQAQSFPFPHTLLNLSQSFPVCLFLFTITASHYLSSGSQFLPQFLQNFQKWSFFPPNPTSQNANCSYKTQNKKEKKRKSSVLFTYLIPLNKKSKSIWHGT